VASTNRLVVSTTGVTREVLVAYVLLKVATAVWPLFICFTGTVWVSSQSEAAVDMVAVSVPTLERSKDSSSEAGPLCTKLAPEISKLIEPAGINTLHTAKAETTPDTPSIIETITIK